MKPRELLYNKDNSLCLATNTPCSYQIRGSCCVCPIYGSINQQLIQLAGEPSNLELRATE